MTTPEKAAKFFIMLANQSEDDFITNLKLNKLLYYAQGVHLARTDTPLFGEEIEAWQYGPVVPSVYRTYKVCGRNPIPAQDGSLSKDDFDPEDLETLLDVEREYGQYTGAKLVSLTHSQGSPWRGAYDAKKTVIPQNDIKSYFKAFPLPRFEPSSSIERVTVLPADWYDPSEDEEWEAYL